jgi:hypothetical protein
LHQVRPAAAATCDGTLCFTTECTACLLLWHVSKH